MTLHLGYSRTRSSPKVRTPTGGWISAPGKEGAVLLSLGAVQNSYFPEALALMMNFCANKHYCETVNVGKSILNLRFFVYTADFTIRLTVILYTCIRHFNELNFRGQVFVNTLRKLNYGGSGYGGKGTVWLWINAYRPVRSISTFLFSMNLCLPAIFWFTGVLAPGYWLIPIYWCQTVIVYSNCPMWVPFKIGHWQTYIGSNKCHIFRWQALPSLWGTGSTHRVAALRFFFPYNSRDMGVHLYIKLYKFTNRKNN